MGSQTPPTSVWEAVLGSLESYDSVLNIFNTILTGTTDKPKVSRPVQDEDDDVGRQQISQIRNQRVICLTSGEIGMRILFFKDQIRSGFLQSINTEPFLLTLIPGWMMMMLWICSKKLLMNWIRQLINVLTLLLSRINSLRPLGLKHHWLKFTIVFSSSSYRKLN